MRINADKVKSINFYNLNNEIKVLNCVNSAYLMVVGQYGTNGTSNNYVLDIDCSLSIIDISSYQNGYYTVTLVCDGEIIDAKNLLKQ